MKKIFSYLMILGALGILSSCSGNTTVMTEDLTSKQDIVPNSSQTNNELAEIKTDDGPSIDDIKIDGKVINAYYDDFPINGADPKTLEPIDKYYSKDKDHVYSGGFVINGADPMTFERIDDFRSKDKDHVYTLGFTIKGADPETFEPINNTYSKDKDHVYSGGFVIDDADPKTFEPINNTYSKDKNYIYSSTKKTIADMKTFQTLADNFGKDKNGIYYYDSLLGEIDPSTFQLMGGPYYKDKNGVYGEKMKIIGVDIATFIVLENGYAKDKNVVYFNGKIIPEADSATFINARDKNAIYSGSYRMKTENRTETVSDNGAEDTESRITFSITMSKEDEDYLKANTFYSCGDEKCFNEKFASCSPVTMTSDAQIFGAVSYDVRNKTKNGCNVAFKYTKYSDPSWVGKEMVCEVNNKIGFQEAWSKVFENVTNGTLKCTGPLYTILHPQT